MSHGRTLGELSLLAQPLCKIYLQPQHTRYSLSHLLGQQDVAKKSKIESDESAGKSAQNAGANALKSSASPVKKTGKKTTQPKRRTRPASEKSPRTGRSPKAEKRAVAPASGPSDDAIRLRAYFLAERRMKLSIPGDSAHDWIEARRQLIEEAGAERAE
jgi:hypothetical protein